MATATYIGVDGKARKVKAMYIGVDGKARKVKAGYIGVGGKARLFYKAEEDGIKYVKTLTSSYKHYRIASASSEEYVYFAGGFGTAYLSLVECFGKELEKVPATALAYSSYEIGGACVNNMVVFVCGTTGGKTLFARVTRYSAPTTRLVDTNLSVARRNPAGATVGDWAVFAGGQQYYSASGKVAHTNRVDAISSTGTQRVPTALRTDKFYMQSGSTPSYAIYAGGQTSSTVLNSVEAYDANLTRIINVSTLPQAVTLGGAVTTDKYFIVAGGFQSNTNYAIKDASYYDDALENRPIESLPRGRRNMLATSIKNNACFFCGSYNSATIGVNDADYYTEEFVRRTAESLPVGRCDGGAGSVGDYGFFYCGRDESGAASDEVDIYSL